MYRILKLLLTLGMVLSIGLTACSPAAEAPIATEVPVVTQAPVAPPILAVKGLVNQELNLAEADLQAMGPVTLTLEHPKNGPTEYTGVRLSTVMEKAGLAEGAGALLITASDGFSFEAPLADIQACADCLIAFADGKLNMAMPGMSSKAWVKDVVTLELTGG